MIIFQHANTSANTKTTTSSGCLTCGVIDKSGKLSCCARGGSWFGKCGATANAQVQHTWHEGIQVCKARKSKTVVWGEQRNEVQQQNNLFSGDTANVTNSKIVITATRKSASTLTATPVSDISPYNVRTNASVAAPVIRPIGHLVNKVIDDPMNRDIASFYSSGSTLTIARECESFQKIVVHVSILFMIVIC